MDVPLQGVWEIAITGIPDNTPGAPEGATETIGATDGAPMETAGTVLAAEGYLDGLTHVGQGASATGEGTISAAC